jgi:hypothetical protein
MMVEIGDDKKEITVLPEPQKETTPKEIPAEQPVPVEEPVRVPERV